MIAEQRALKEVVNCSLSCSYIDQSQNALDRASFGIWTLSVGAVTSYRFGCGLSALIQ